VQVHENGFHFTTSPLPCRQSLCHLYITLALSQVFHTTATLKTYLTQLLIHRARRLHLHPQYRHVLSILKAEAERWLTPPQVAGNMLGARARAAEYHAAKAASARQQANDDEDEQKIPKPAPISLIAFTRNAFSNRNKGVKTFKPLVLSEEEERRSSSSIDLGSETYGSPLSQPDTYGPPRAASVPVPHNLAGGHFTQPERTVQTPYRYREPHMPSMATRTMVSDDEYGYPAYGPPFPPQYLQAPYYAHSVMQQPMISTPPIRWYMSPGCYPPQQSYHDAVVPPVTPLPDIRPSTCPQLQHLDSMENYDQAEPQQKFSSDRTLSDPPKTPPKMRGQKLYVFGPDDVSPTKIEMKQQAREKYLAEHGDLLPTSIAGMVDRSVWTPEPLEMMDKDELRRHLDITSKARPKAQRTLSGNLKDLLIDRNSIFPVKRRPEETSPVSWKLQLFAKPEETVTQGNSEGDWPYLGQVQSRQTVVTDTDSKHTGEVFSGQTHGVATDTKQVLATMRAKSASSVMVRPPPGLEQISIESNNCQESEFEQITSIHFPLINMNSPEWLDVRLPTAAEQDQMRRVCHAVKTSSISDKHRSPADARRGIVRDNLKNWIQVKVHNVEARRCRVDELAEEMQRKWKQDGSLGSATMSKADAEKHAGTVKAVGGIISALGMQLDEHIGSSQRRGRPYCQAPDYAIERSVGTGKSTSLFESKDDATRSAPPRLARDPRFRPQFANGMKLAAEEGRIPRMFAARRAM